MSSILFIIFPWYRKQVTLKQIEERQRILLQQINEKASELRNLIVLNFLVDPCSSCFEFSMKLLDISPNARSLQYECSHCNKKMSAAAGTPKASQVIEVWDDIISLIENYNDNSEIKLSRSIVEFTTPQAALPFEQTSRTSIPESIRSEVWRRDLRKCVQCGSNQNLQFDHIIPVSKGGATSVQNLQLLCRQCNLRKSAKI